MSSAIQQHNNQVGGTKVRYALNPWAQNTQIVLIRGSGSVSIKHRSAMVNYDKLIDKNKKNPTHADYDETYILDFNDPKNYTDATYEDTLSPDPINLAANSGEVTTITLNGQFLSSIMIDDTGNTGDLWVEIIQS